MLVLLLSVLILGSVLVFPERILDGDLGVKTRQLQPSEFAKAKNDIRTTLLQGIGGLLVLLGAGIGATVGLRQLALNREGQITERFTRAIDQLGSDRTTEVRIGGIYALERIARDSEPDRGPIIEVLSAYLHQHAPQPDTPWCAISEDGGHDPPQAIPSSDVQAVLTVMRRREPIAGGWTDPALDLAKLGLQGADLHGAHLESADLNSTHMEGGNLEGAHLKGANLIDVRLHWAKLNAADLRGAILLGARLPRSKIERAQLQDARLDGANLRHAKLRHARASSGEFRGAYLEYADLADVDLEAADLRGAHLEGALLWRANLRLANLAKAELRGAELDDADLGNSFLQAAELDQATLRNANLEGANLTQARLQDAIGLDRAKLAGAIADQKTTWPEGFDWKAAGMVIEESES
jgi:uncharacterized protein YjbI with pentapeptide repeats